MNYWVCNGMGESKERPSEQDLRTFLSDLDPADTEHGAVWVSDEFGNSLEFNVDGRLVFSRDGDEEERHILGVSPQQVLDFWLLLIGERVHDLEGQPWMPGTRPPLTPEEAARRERDLLEDQRFQDRKFYELLGPEREGHPCRKDGCHRCRISHSALCRVHHFENIRGRHCPFDD